MAVPTTQQMPAGTSNTPPAVQLIEGSLQVLAAQLAELFKSRPCQATAVTLLASQVTPLTTFTSLRHSVGDLLMAFACVPITLQPLVGLPS